MSTVHETNLQEFHTGAGFSEHDHSQQIAFVLSSRLILCSSCSGVEGEGLLSGRRSGECATIKQSVGETGTCSDGQHRGEYWEWGAAEVLERALK